jgi:hypothetical protein
VISASWSTDESGTPAASADPLQLAEEQVSSDIAGTASGTPEDQATARQQLRASVPHLYGVLMSSDQPLDAPALEQVFTTMTHGADILARDAEILPGTDLGQIVLGILEAALPAEPPSRENP